MYNSVQHNNFHPILFGSTFRKVSPYENKAEKITLNSLTLT